MEDSRKQELKERLQEYVEQITQKSKGANMYNCPLCGSGTGQHKTGAFSIKGTRWTCYACGKGGDIFDLIGKKEGIPDKAGQFRRAEEIFNYPSSQYQNQPRNKQVTQHTQLTQVTQQEESGEIIDFTPLYEEGKRNIENTTYWKKRGLSLETVKAYNIGYIENWKSPKAPNSKPTPRLILPITAYSYTARATTEKAERKAINTRGREVVEWIFNSEALTSSTKPLFIVEGIIDALSIIEVGGQAIATSGTANTGQLLRLLEKKKPAQPLILALDKDTAGQTAEEKLAKGLEEMQISFYRLDIYGNSKDANEMLLKDREEFRKVIIEAEAKVIDLENAKAQKEQEAYSNEYSAKAYLLNNFYKELSENASTPPIPTGFSGLDAVLYGGLYEGLYIIGAISSLGKTTFALQIADQIAQQGRDTLIISLEMAKSELIAKSLSRHTVIEAIAQGISTGDAKTQRGIQRGDLWEKYSKREHALINKAIDDYSKYAGNLFILEGQGNIKAETIREAVKMHKERRGVAPVVIVDYLQILAPADIRDTEKRATDKNILELKRLSRDYKIPVIGISSLNRSNYKEKISFEALKESGGIEYGSDIVIGLQLKGAGSKDFEVNKAKNKDPREIEAVILKHRSGKTGDTINYLYYPLFNYFVETEPEPERKRIVY